jgi:hypothetical protein
MLGRKNSMGRKMSTVADINKRLEGRNIILLSKEYTTPGEKLRWKCAIDGYEWVNTVSEVLNNRSNCIKCNGRKKILSVSVIQEKLLELGGRFNILSLTRSESDEVLLFWDNKNKKQISKTWEGIRKLAEGRRNTANVRAYDKEYTESKDKS